MPIVPSELYYWVGEKPPALICRYQDKDGNLITSIAADGLTAKCKIGSGTEFDIVCTNPYGGVDGQFSIPWATGGTASSFDAAGSMKIDVEVDDGTRVWFLPRFSIEVLDR